MVRSKCHLHHIDFLDHSILLKGPSASPSNETFFGCYVNLEDESTLVFNSGGTMDSLAPVPETLRSVCRTTGSKVQSPMTNRDTACAAVPVEIGIANVGDLETIAHGQCCCRLIRFFFIISAFFFAGFLRGQKKGAKNALSDTHTRTHTHTHARH